MRNLFLALAAAVVALGAQTAAAQDSAPPGCRWQGFQGEQILACKDGKGYWRRSGDGEIVGRYALAKPKPKPAAAPSMAGAEPAPPSPPPSQGDAVTAPAAQPQASPPAKAAPPQAVLPSGAEPPAEPPKPWWRKLLDGFWNGVLGLLRLVGLLH